MGIFQILAILITLAAAFSYVNYRWLKLPTTIALMLMSLGLSLLLLGLNFLPGGHELEQAAERLVAGIDFHQVLMEGMLGLLLFAGALHVNLNDLAEHKWQIGTFATAGVVVSTLLVGAAVWGLSAATGLGLPWLACLLFGALISPTDPIAVLGIMRRAGAPRDIEVRLAGESLFNDGVGVVVFLALLGLYSGTGGRGPADVAGLFALEVLGGVVFGLGVGYLVFVALRSIDDYRVEVLLTLALVVGGYALAQAIHISGPLAMVVAGLMIGNHGRRLAMSRQTREHLEDFWELIDESLNAVLFVLIGLEVLVLTLSPRFLLAGLAAVPVVLLARLVTIWGAKLLLHPFGRARGHVVAILTWGGLRGGISVALALSLPAGPHRNLILTMTYVVVAFSILVQGLTVGRLVRMLGGRGRGRMSNDE